MCEIRSFLMSLSRGEIKSFRNAEKTVKKLSKCDSAIKFNNACLKEDILPKYTNVRDYHNSRGNNARITVDFRKGKVKNELEEKKRI